MPDKLGAVIYLRASKALQLAEVASAFRVQWPGALLRDEGLSGNVSHFLVGESHIELAFCHGKVPSAVTESAFPCGHWAHAQQQLEQHVAHLKLAAPIDPGMALRTAFDLTRMVVSLLSITDAIGTCWLNSSPRNASG